MGLELEPQQNFSIAKVTKAQALDEDGQVPKRQRKTSSVAERNTSPSRIAKEMSPTESSPYIRSTEIHLPRDRTPHNPGYLPILNSNNNIYGSEHFDAGRASKPFYAFPELDRFHFKPNDLVDNQFSTQTQSSLDGVSGEALDRHIPSSSQFFNTHADLLGGLEFQRYANDANMLMAGQAQNIFPNALAAPEPKATSMKDGQTYHSASKSILFGDQAMSLPNMPFGIAMHEMPNIGVPNPPTVSVDMLPRPDDVWLLRNS